MIEHIERQFSLINHFIGEYKQGILSLNTLIQRIEEFSCVIDVADFRNAIFPIIVKIEEINAVALEANANLSVADEKLIEQSLHDLEQIIKHFRDLTY